MNALQTTLKQLRLSGLSQTLEVRLQEAAANRLSHVPTAGAIIDRFLHHAQVVAITGKSYRIKEAPALNQENKKNRKADDQPTAGAAS